MRIFQLALLGSICIAAQPAILPETIAKWQKGPAAVAPVPNPKVWAEYGLQDSETATYTDGDRKFPISAWRFGDATGALAGFYELRPVDSKISQLMGVSAENADEQIVAAGNYLFVFRGQQISPEELSHVVATVPKYEHSPLPSLPKYMPPDALRGSERYIMGPAGLAQFVPGISASIVGFHFSAEGEVARYGAKGKETTIVIFSYPALEMARDRYQQFQAVPGLVAKRTGPMVAVAVNPSNPDEAENLLSTIKYQAAVTLPEHPPAPPFNFGSFLVGILKLIGVVLLFCVLSGVMVAGIRILFRRAGPSGDGDQMISLHLTEKR